MAEITGKIIAVLPTRSGTSARGTQWSSQTAVIETHEQYPKRVAFDVLGDKITEFNLQVGEEVTVSFDINAREYNGKWWNSVNAWQVVRQGGQQAPMQGGYNMSPHAGAQAASSSAGSYGWSTKPDEYKQSVSTGTAARSTGRAS